MVVHTAKLDVRPEVISHHLCEDLSSLRIIKELPGSIVAE